MPEPRPHALAGRLGGNVFSLTSSRLLSMLLAFVQTAVIVSALGREAFGRYAFALAVASICTVFATLGAQRVLTRGVAQSPRTAWLQTWTAWFWTALLSTFVVIVLAAAAFRLETDLRRNALVASGFAVILFWAWQQPFESMLMGRERVRLVSFLLLIESVLRVACIVAFIGRVPSGAGAHAVVALANFLGFLIFAVAAVWVERDSVRPRISWPLLRAQVRECLPLSLTMICSLLYFKSDLAIVSALRGDGEAGVYGLVQRITEPAMMLSSMMGAALFPTLCRLAGNEKDAFATARTATLRWVMIFSIPLAAGIALLAGPLILLLSRERFGEFRVSVPVLQLTCAAIPWFYFNGLAMEFYYASGRNWGVFRIYALAAVASVAANLVLTPRYGAMGAAGVAVGINVGIGLLYGWTLRHDIAAAGLPVLVLKSALATGIMSGVVFAALQVSALLAVLAGVVTYPIAMWLLRALNRQEQRLLVSCLQRSNLP